MSREEYMNPNVTSEPRYYNMQSGTQNIHNTNALNAAMPQSPPPVRVSVHDSLTEQSGLIGDIYGLLANLESSLGSVLMPVPQQGVPANEKPNDPPQRVVDRIQDNTRGLRFLAERLASIVQRLEL